MARTKKIPVKKRSSIVYRGYKPRRKSSRKALPKLNYVRHRMVAVKQITSTAAQSKFNVVIPWQQPALNNVPNATYIGFNSSARWAVVRENWDQYAITGLKVEWIPTQTYPTRTTPHIGALWKVDNADSYDILPQSVDNSVIQMPGFRALSCTRPFRKFYSLKKLSKQQNVAWQDNQAYNANQPNSLTKAATMLRFFVVNPAAVTWGTVKCTFYVKMRG